MSLECINLHLSRAVIEFELKFKVTDHFELIGTVPRAEMYTVDV